MIGWIIFGAGYILIPSGFNIAVTLYKRKKTLNKCIENLEKSGYKVDYRFKEEIPKIIITKVFNIKYEDSDYYFDFVFSTYFGSRWIEASYSIKYLMGDYTGFNEIYADLEDACLEDETIKVLENEGIIEEDKEKKKWIKDRNNALKELEEKYDDIDLKIDDKYKINTFSESDSIDELHVKMEKLQELIDRKEAKTEDIKSLGLGNTDGRRKLE